MIGIITKRKINQIFSKFPTWSQDDIAYLSIELRERKKILIATINRKNANQIRDRDHLADQVKLFEEGLNRLEAGQFNKSAHYELFTTLFNSYLKSDGRKVKLESG